MHRSIFRSAIQRYTGLKDDRVGGERNNQRTAYQIIWYEQWPNWSLNKSGRIHEGIFFFKIQRKRRKRVDRTDRITDQAITQLDEKIIGKETHVKLEARNAGKFWIKRGLVHWLVFLVAAFKWE